MSEAIKSFLGQCEVEASTMRRYTRVMSDLSRCAESHGAMHVNDLSVDLLDRLHSERALSALTWSCRISQTLRQFFSFCLDRKWIDDNPARRLKMPSDPRPREREPYSSDEHSHASSRRAMHSAAPRMNG